MTVQIELTDQENKYLLGLLKEELDRIHDFLVSGRLRWYFPSDSRLQNAKQQLHKERDIATSIHRKLGGDYKQFEEEPLDAEELYDVDFDGNEPRLVTITLTDREVAYLRQLLDRELWELGEWFWEIIPELEMYPHDSKLRHELGELKDRWDVALSIYRKLGGEDYKTFEEECREAEELYDLNLADLLGGGESC